MNGNVPDKRAPNVAGEITAMYWHGVNRAPDSGGFNQYMWFANQNCRWGVLSASFQILNSAEAHNVWRNNPQTLAGMLYAALLNRPPDKRTADLHHRHHPARFALGHGVDDGLA